MAISWVVKLQVIYMCVVGRENFIDFTSLLSAVV